MSDTKVTLTWKPALPLGPNLAPYYMVEMAEYPEGDWEEVSTRYKDTRHGQHFGNRSFVALKRKFISISPNLGAQCVQLDQSDCLL